MKIAVVFPLPWFADDPVRSSIDLSLYINAARELGHEACVICPGTREAKVDYPIQLADEQSLGSVEFWRAQHIDLAIAFTWLKHAPMLAAMQQANIYVCSRADTDGMMSIRRRPWHHLRAAWASAKGPVRKIRAARWWLHRFLFRAAREARDTLDSISAADVVAIETRQARQQILDFLDEHHRGDLAEKLMVLPHIVGPAFLDFPVNRIIKRRKVVAIGRWDAPQKDGPLLARALHRFLRQSPDVEVTLIGPNGAALFDRLCRDFPGARYVGPLPRSQILDHLASARTIVFSSRWEGSPISANEALALGASVVGPRLPSLLSITREGPFGAVSRRNSRALAAALDAEMNAWDRNERDPGTIAAYWRPLLAPERFIRIVTQLAATSGRIAQLRQERRTCIRQNG